MGDVMAEARSKSETRRIIRAVCSRIKYQFPDCPDGTLMFKVLEQAIKDAFDPDKIGRVSAISYLKGDMEHALICGVNPDWVRSTLDKAGLIIRHTNNPDGA